MVLTPSSAVDSGLNTPSVNLSPICSPKASVVSGLLSALRSRPCREGPHDDTGRKADIWHLRGISRVRKGVNSRAHTGRPFIGASTRTNRRAPIQNDPGEAASGMASMGKSDINVSELCMELGITRQTLYRHVSPNGKLRSDGEKPFSKKKG